MFGKKKDEDYSSKTVSTNVDKLTTIAFGTVIRGTITVEGDLRLDGTAEGDISCKGKMVIGPKGRVKGNVACSGAVLHGVLEGDIHVTEDLVLKSSCTMQGDIYTCKLEIEPQAKFNGVCNTNTTEKKVQTTVAANPVSHNNDQGKKK